MVPEVLLILSDWLSFQELLSTPHFVFLIKTNSALINARRKTNWILEAQEDSSPALEFVEIKHGGSRRSGSGLMFGWSLGKCIVRRKGGH